VTFIGDWTRRDEAIRAELARFGKAGVPLYLVYSPGAPDRPAVLPELLTVDLFLNALRAAAPEKEKTT
jgi:thiol:disulfide interchange protein DsbD